MGYLGGLVRADLARSSGSRWAMCGRVHESWCEAPRASGVWGSACRERHRRAGCDLRRWRVPHAQRTRGADVCRVAGDPAGCPPCTSTCHPGGCLVELRRAGHIRQVAAVECWQPLGRPVVPDVNIRNSGRSPAVRRARRSRPLCAQQVVDRRCLHHRVLAEY